MRYIKLIKEFSNINLGDDVESYVKLVFSDFNDDFPTSSYIINYAHTYTAANGGQYKSDYGVDYDIAVFFASRNGVEYGRDRAHEEDYPTGFFSKLDYSEIYEYILDKVDLLKDDNIKVVNTMYVSPENHPDKGWVMSGDKILDPDNIYLETNPQNFPTNKYTEPNIKTKVDRFKYVGIFFKKF